ncbi:hypothetical protein N9U58_00065 [Pelagibacteraceae bacterium]|nr:hypothetical protein [Pelagibacteraceae bacterium]
MKKLLAIAVLGLLLNGCGDSESDYDKGYEDAWEGYSPKKSSDSYMEGYEEGEFDADCDHYKRNLLWDKYRAIKCHLSE